MQKKFAKSGMFNVPLHSRSAIKRTELAQRVGRAQCLYSIPRSHVLLGWLRGIPIRGCVVSGDNTKQQLGNYSVTIAFGNRIAQLGERYEKNHY